MANPFFNRGPIQDSRFFLSREKETREVVRLLAGVQNCSIIGPVKSGKTSLLLHLSRPEVLSAHGLPAAQYAVVYLSFEGLADLRPEQFFCLLLRETARQGRGKIGLIWPQFEKREAISFLELRQSVEQLEVAGERLVVCLDEVELAAENPAFDLNFFSALRSIASHASVCFVTATERRLHELKVAGRQVGSPFADLFSVVRLGPVGFEEAWPSLSSLALAESVDIGPERDLIRDLGGGWPHHLQVVAYEVFEARDSTRPESRPSRPLREEEREFVSLRAYEQVEPVLTIIWERLSKGERQAAVAALGGGGATPEIEGLMVSDAGHTQPMNALVERFLRERQRDQEAPVEAYFTGGVGLPDRMTVYSLVRALMRAVEARDRYARGHADQVTRFAVAIAKEMGCADEFVEGVKVAARLHDIGRVSISDMILLKPGPLTGLETEIVRTHPLVAVQILDALEFPWSVKPAIRYHHERLDGSGYPEGLMGDEIPLSARLLAVADTIAAMTADRPYRHALPREEAIQYLTANAGVQYDGAAVAALERVVTKGLV
jgi:HD-GYP domain-containing protein (c-di-GMP phosphodiesterase class II)